MSGISGNSVVRGDGDIVKSDIVSYIYLLTVSQSVSQILWHKY